MTYIFEQFNLGKTNDQVRNELIGKGLIQKDAQSIVKNARMLYAANPNVTNVTDNLRRSVAAQRGWKRMRSGFFWLVLGSLIPWGTYSVAASSPYGGSYTICYGAIALGGIYFLWGLLEWLINR